MFDTFSRYSILMQYISYRRRDVYMENSEVISLDWRLVAVLVIVLQSLRSGVPIKNARSRLKRVIKNFEFIVITNVLNHHLIIIKSERLL